MCSSDLAVGEDGGAAHMVYLAALDAGLDHGHTVAHCLNGGVGHILDLLGGVGLSGLQEVQGPGNVGGVADRKSVV